MSARASAYAKTLSVCPNGEMITPREKLVLIVLADAHQDRAKHFTYPSIETIAEDAMCDRRSCQRYLAALQRKGVIERLRPANQGRGMQVFYFFTALDDVPEGWQPAALFGDSFSRRRAAEGRQKGGRRAANGAPALLERAQELELELEQKPNTTPPTPLVAEGAKTSEEQSDAGETKGSAASVAAITHTGAVVVERVPEKAHAIQPSTARFCTDGIAGMGKDAGVAREDDVDLAVESVAKCLGVANRRKRKLFRAVIELEMQSGTAPDVTAAAMVDAWNKQAAKSAVLFRKFGLAEFFGDGIWKDSERWHWNEALLRERAGASVGSYM